MRTLGVANTANAIFKFSTVGLTLDIMAGLDREFDDLRSHPRCEGWPIAGISKALTIYKLPDIRGVCEVVTDSMVNHLYFLTPTQLSHYKMNGFHPDIANYIEFIVREKIHDLKLCDAVGKYNDVVRGNGVLHIKPTDNFIAVERLKRGIDPWI